jgi:hypothetical protein
MLVSCMIYSSTLKMVAVGFSGTSIGFQRNTGRYILEERERPSDPATCVVLRKLFLKIEFWVFVGYLCFFCSHALFIQTFILKNYNFSVPSQFSPSFISRFIFSKGRRTEDVIFCAVSALYLLTYLLAELSSFWEAANCAAAQELPSILWNSKVHCVFTRALH